MTDAKEQAGSEPSGPRPVEVEAGGRDEFGSGPKPSSYADTQPGADYRGTAIPPGALLAGRYRIDHFIARGGMGEVYAAHDCVLADRIALKTVTGTSSGDMGALAALRAEVTLSRKISHPNVCRMHDIGVHVSQVAPQLTFLTMEYIDGESLGARVAREGAIEEREAARLLSGILMGLQAAHEAGVLHRDLKSDNVMLRLRPNADPSPVIMDFGLASALSPNSSRVSSEQAMVGSLAYMAPEQVQGDALRVATDIYSVGVVFFEMLTGQLPFKASSPALAALKRLHEPAPRVRSIDPRLSVKLDRILAKALQHRPQDRYQSARAMLQDVTDFLQHGDTGEPSDRPSISVTSERSSEPRTDPMPLSEFDADETTLVTGRAHRSEPATPRARAKSEPPPSVDHSLPVLAATAPPARERRPRRLAGLLFVGAAAAAVVLLVVAGRLARKDPSGNGSGATGTIGIGVPNTPPADVVARMRSSVNTAVSPVSPADVVTAGAGSVTAPEPTSASAPVVASSPPKRVASPKTSPARPAAAPTAATTVAANPAPTVGGAATESSVGLVYPPGIKKPAALQPTGTPSVQ